MNAFAPPDPSLLFSRHDPSDPRLGDRVAKSAQDADVAIVGYPDDEGIHINGGRLGAKAGPDAIRNWLYRMTPHPKMAARCFCDLGNLKAQGDLNQRHTEAASTVEDVLLKKQRVLALGGGNDYAYADGLGFLRACGDPKIKPVIVNVDAHLDVRDPAKGLSSGTPFFRLLELNQEFDFVELGIQTLCNSRAHWQYVEAKGGHIIAMDEILQSGTSLVECVTSRLGDLLLKARPAFLAIDIDAFAYPFAEGSSAPWPLGLLPHDFYPLLALLLKRWDVRVMGIYEVSPSLSQGHASAKLAAQWAHMFLHEPG